MNKYPVKLPSLHNKIFNHLIPAALTAALLFTVPFLLSGCRPSKTVDCDCEELNVVTTIFAPYDFARAVAGGDGTSEGYAHVTMLLKPGTEVHSYDPTARDIITIDDCDLFIYVGGENDAWVEDILSSLKDPPAVLRLVDSVDLYREDENVLDSEQEDGAEWDEHVWTAPANAAKIVSDIRDEMKALDPSHAVEFEDNAEAYIDQIEDLDAEFSDMISKAPIKTLVFADRFPVRYFTEEYGLSYIAAYPGCAADSEPSAATVASLIDSVKNDRIPAVFYTEMSNQAMADTVCEETGCRKLEFHSCHNVTAEDFEAGETYVSLMKRNLENVRYALYDR